jgi:hypothetical protein
MGRLAGRGTDEADAGAGVSAVASTFFLKKEVIIGLSWGRAGLGANACES